MRNQAPQTAKQANTGRILPFRPRTSASAPHADAALASDVEPSDAAPDDFRHRMLVNAAGLAFAVVLTSVGVWLAVSISNLRGAQDCVLSGRRDCAPIVALDRQSPPLRQH